MSDLVKRLRVGEPCAEASADNTCKVKNAESGCLCAIAADRIEQLENALTEIYKKGLHNQGGAYKNGFYDCFKIARRALGIPHMSFDAARAALGEKP